MEEIEVGEYVRTKDGLIGSFDRYSKRPDTSIYKSPFNCFIKLNGRKTPLQCHRDYIEKHSHNIIDLIEPEDYVNGYRVVNVIIDPAPSGKCVDIDSSKDSSECTIWEEDIKSIVTHEQFKQAEYRVEE